MIYRCYETEICVPCVPWGYARGTVWVRDQISRALGTSHLNTMNESNTLLEEENANEIIELAQMYFDYHWIS